MVVFLSFCLSISKKAVPLHRVFHSIRFKVNKGWSKALLLFLPIRFFNLLQATFSPSSC